MNCFDNAFIYGSLKRGVESTQGNYWRQLVKGLGSTAERRMRGCPVSLNRLIIRMFWLKCKDERKRRNDRLGEDGSIFPYIKNIPSFLKKMVMFLRNITIFLENIKVFLQHGSVPKLNLAPTNQKTALSTFWHIPLFVKCVRTHRATHTVASGHTYIRIELHVRTHEPARIYVIVAGSVITDSLSMGDKGRNNKSPSNMQFDGLLSLISSLLDYQDSNLDKQNQNLLCYHYTIVQT